MRRTSVTVRDGTRRRRIGERRRELLVHVRHLDARRQRRRAEPKLVLNAGGRGELRRERHGRALRYEAIGVRLRIGEQRVLRELAVQRSSRRR